MDLAQLVRAAARAADTFAAGPAGTPAVVWQAFGPWITRLLGAAAERWMPVLVAQIPCQVHPPGRPCQNAAVASCDVCGAPVCLEHARVDYAGGAICLSCVARAVQSFRDAAPAPGQGEARRPPQQPVTRAELHKAAKVLGVEPGCSDSELRSAYRKRSAKWHPDRHPNNTEEAERRFKKVQAAYETMQRAREAA